MGKEMSDFGLFGGPLSGYYEGVRGLSKFFDLHSAVVQNTPDVAGFVFARQTRKLAKTSISQ